MEKPLTRPLSIQDENSAIHHKKVAIDGNSKSSKAISKKCGATLKIRKALDDISNHKSFRVEASGKQKNSRDKKPTDRNLNRRVLDADVSLTGKSSISEKVDSAEEGKSLISEIVDSAEEVKSLIIEKVDSAEGGKSSISEKVDSSEEGKSTINEKADSAEEGFLHDHSKCIEAQKAAWEPDFWETVLPRHGIADLIIDQAKSDPAVDSFPELADLSMSDWFDWWWKSPPVSPVRWNYPPGFPFAWNLELMELKLKEEDD